MTPAALLISFLAFMSSGIPVAIAMAGGYARDIDDSVAIHANTLCTARRIHADS